MSIHHTAMKCLDEARRLNAEGTENALRYACLQLRMAIEHLFYELLPSYKAELPTAVFDQWQPKQILDALIECNPDVTQNCQVAIKDSPEGAALFAGAQTAVTKKLLRDNYHRLGSFLHAPLHGKPLSMDGLRDAVAKAIKAVESYRSDRVIANIGEYVTFPCVKCNHPFKRRWQALPPDGRVTCLNSKCSALHSCYRNPDESYRVELITCTLHCELCNSETLFDEPDCRPGSQLRCKQCGRKYQIVERLVPQLADAG